MLNILKEEAMLLIMSYFVRHNITKTALIDLLKLINLILGIKSLPESHYLFTKFFSESLEYSKQYYCGTCNLYLGALTADLLNNVCTNCSNNEKKYFISNTIGSKITDIIERNYKSIMSYKEKLKSTILSDIVQGKFVSSFEKLDFFSISFNTDGMSLFASNLKKSCWPIILTINDLPPKLRYLKNNMIVAGLWLDSNVSIDIFMKPFIKELSELYDKGLYISNKFYKIICTALCVDSVARCKVLKMKQFNGTHGCTYCLHPGVNVKIGGKLLCIKREDTQINMI